MDAIVTAGGIPLPEEPLYPYTEGKSKAMLDVAGKPMIQWTLDALSGAKNVERVVIVGLPAKSGVTCKKPLTFIPNQGKMIENIRAGVAKVLELNRKTRHVLAVSSDIPAITSEMVDWAVATAMETDDDIYYNIIPRPVMEKRFPASRRTYTHLKDMEVCGGDMNVARASLISKETDLWERIINARKSPLKQAALIGYGTLFLLLLRKLTLEDVIGRVTKRLGVTGRAIVCPYAEVGMDVDKPHQLELLRKDLKRKQRRAEGKPKGALASKKKASGASKTSGKRKAK